MFSLLRVLPISCQSENTGIDESDVKDELKQLSEETGREKDEVTKQVKSIVAFFSCRFVTIYNQRNNPPQYWNVRKYGYCFVVIVEHNSLILLKLRKK